MNLLNKIRSKFSEPVSSSEVPFVGDGNKGKKCQNLVKIFAHFSRLCRNDPE